MRVSKKKDKNALFALQLNNIVPAFFKKRKSAKDLHALLVLNKRCSYISHGRAFLTILGFWLNLAYLFFLSRISVGSFSPQGCHVYTVVIGLSYYFVYVKNYQQIFLIRRINKQDSIRIKDIIYT